MKKCVTTLTIVFIILLFVVLDVLFIALFRLFLFNTDRIQYSGFLIQIVVLLRQSPKL